MVGAAGSGPRPIPPVRLGPFCIRAWIARGRRADVWWADSDVGPVALRVPHPGLPRARFDAEQRRAYAASGRRGDLRPEGAVEVLVRGDNLAHLQAGASVRGPVSEAELASLAHGLLLALAEHVHGHGDLAPSHILVGEAGTVRLIDADPEGFLQAPARPGRAGFLPEAAASALASDLHAAERVLRALWIGARPAGTPAPSWLERIPEAPDADAALDVLERSVGRVDPSGADRERGQLLARLCPERRRAFSEVLAQDAAPKPPLEAVLTEEARPIELTQRKTRASPTEATDAGTDPRLRRPSTTSGSGLRGGSTEPAPRSSPGRPSPSPLPSRPSSPPPSRASPSPPPRSSSGVVLGPEVGSKRPSAGRTRAAGASEGVLLEAHGEKGGGAPPRALQRAPAGDRPGDAAPSPRVGVAPWVPPVLIEPAESQEPTRVDLSDNETLDDSAPSLALRSPGDWATLALAIETSAELNEPGFGTSDGDEVGATLEVPIYQDRHEPGGPDARAPTDDVRRPGGFSDGRLQDTPSKPSESEPRPRSGLASSLSGTAAGEETTSPAWALREPPDLGLAPEALVPTRLVRRRILGRPATAGEDVEVADPSLMPSPTGSPVLGALEPAEIEQQDARLVPERADPWSVAAAVPGQLPREPSASTSSKAEAAPDEDYALDDEPDMVVPVSDAELARIRLDRRLTIALALVVTGLAALVIALAFDRVPALGLY